MENISVAPRTYYAKTSTIAVLGVQAFAIEVECHQSLQLPGFQIVGLPKTTVKESRERVRSALASTGYTLPSRKIVVNLSPAWLEKDGTSYDLAIAIACLVASGVIAQERVQDIAILGELALDGHIKEVQAAYAVAPLLKKSKFASAILPLANSHILSEKNLQRGGGFKHISEVVEFLKTQTIGKRQLLYKEKKEQGFFVDFKEIEGQTAAKRMMMIAAAGEHHVLLLGPRGSGKTMLCSALKGIMPALTEVEYEEITAIYAATPIRWDEMRPMRSPHNSITKAALLGGGPSCKPGELSLAHGGVLFLDELLEFQRKTLEVLRLPLEEGNIHLSRGSLQVQLPSRVLFVAASNLCPCGLRGDPLRECLCTAAQVINYRRHLSEALFDRFDLRFAIFPEREKTKKSESLDTLSSEQIKKTITGARSRMLTRQGCPNGRLKTQSIFTCLPWQEDAKAILEMATLKYALSKRSRAAIGRVALTIADLMAANEITKDHIAEALFYRKENI